MADNVVVARYELDTSQFDAGVDEVVKGYAEIDKAAKGAASTGDEVASGLDDVGKAAQNATKGTTALTVSTGSLGAKFAELVEQEARAAAQADELGKAQSKNISIFARVGQGIKQFAAGARDGFKTAIKEVGGFSGITSQLGAKFKGFGATASNALKSVSSGITSSVSQIPLIGGIATALGPVGLAAAAVAGGLFKVITNTDAGATALEGLGKTGGVVFDRVTGLVTGFFDTLTSGTGVIGKTFDVLSGAVDFFINKLTPIGAIFEAISETSIFKALKEDFEFGQQIANQLDELQDKQLGVNEATAANEITIRSNLAALRDTTKPVEERLRLADEITAIEAENLALKKSQLTAELGILQAQAQRQQLAKGEVDDSLKAQISAINVALSNAEADSVSLTERVAARRAGIVQDGLNKDAAARQKAIAAQEKREQEQAKKAEARAQAEAKLNGTVAKLSQEAYERTLTDSEREVEAIKQKYADLEAVTLEGIQKLREASPANEQSAITAREAELVIGIERAKNAELAALREQSQQEALESIRVSLLSQTELEREAVLQRFDELVAAAEQNIDNVEERNAVIEELTAQAQAKLTTIVTDEEQKRLDAQAAAAEQALAFKEQLRDAETALLTTQIDAAAQAASIITSFAGESEAAQAASLIAAKGAAIANVIIQTQAGIAAASAALAAVPPILPPGVPNPAFAAAAALSASQIAKLKIGSAISIATILAQTIQGAYTGEERVGVNEAPQLPGIRDRYLRRVHKNEGIVDAKTNMANLDAINAMRSGTFDDWVMANYLPRFESINDDDRMVQYVNSDMGQRMALSITLPRMFDKNIVESSQAARKEQQRTNDLLAAMLQQSRPRRRNTRYN